jgi:hypothetical protein
MERTLARFRFETVDVRAMLQKKLTKAPVSVKSGGT